VKIFHNTSAKEMKYRIESGVGFTDDPKLLELLGDKKIESKIKRLLYDYVNPKRNLSDCVNEINGLTEIRQIASLSKSNEWDSYRSIYDLAYNVYQHYEAVYNLTFATGIRMNYFIYQGGTDDDSRDFCVAHSNKVWSIEEAEQWKEWTPYYEIKNNQFPEGYEIKQKDIYAVPGYLSYEGYNPLVDRGGYNCRHQLSFITENLALKLREKQFI